MNNQNSSPTRTRRTPWWKRPLLAIGVSAAFLGTTSAQITPTVTYDFNTNATGWTGNITRTTATTACGSASMRRNLYGSVTTGNMVSPSVGTAAGGVVTLTYKYKAAVWSANTTGQNPWGNFNVQYGASAAGPWTTFATVTNEVQNGSCITRSHNFTPPAGALFLKWDCFWTTGDYFINFDDVTVLEAAAGVCSGTPAPGNTTSTSASPCSGANFTLGLQTPTLGSNVTYQWQTSPDGLDPWTNIGGATSSTLVTSHAAATYYRSNVTCPSAGPAVPSNGLLVGLTTGACQCATYPAVFAGSTGDEEITQVVVAGFTNNSTCATLAGGAGSVVQRYSNYAGVLGGPLGFVDSTYTFSLTQTTCLGNYGDLLQLYIDWNQDGDFTDLGEQIYNVSGTGNRTETGSFVVPSGATLGITRMRVVDVEGGDPLTNYSNTAYTWGETEDYCFNVIVPAVCVGTPAPGNTETTASSVCTGVPFTLSLQNFTLGTGVTYQWQTSPDGNAPWTDINLATSATRTGTQAASTYYRCRVTCAGNDGFSTPTLVVFNSGACLCSAYAIVSAGSTADEDISNVTVGTMNNNSDCFVAATGAGSVLNRYANYSGVVAPTSHQQGSTGVPFSLTQTSCGGAFGNGFQIYVDWDQNGDFLGANERVYNQPVSVGGNQTVTGTFDVPGTAFIGTTRMRVVNVETTFPTVTNYSNSPYTWGETEDYCFTVLAPPPCAGTPNSGTAASSTVSVCASGETASLSVTGLSFGTGLTYQWEQSATGGAPWTNVVGGSGATTANYTTAPIVGTIYYRLRSNCSNTVPPADEATSNVITVSIVPCDYDVALTSASWTSIASTGTSFTFTSPFSGDDVRSDNVSLAGTTFLYQGQPVTGMQSVTNGWMTFNTANTSTSFSNGLTSTGQNRVLAPFWDDLVTTGNSIGSLSTSMHYEVIGTLGSGSAVIIVQWTGMERFGVPGPNLNFQVRLYEGSNIIEYVYGDFQGFDGTFNSGYSYSIGYNGANPAGLTPRDRFAMQSAVTNFWSASGDPAAHVIMPDCFTKFVMTPGTYTGPVSAPAVPVPANDASASAQSLTPNAGPCVALCGTYYTSRGATADPDATTCTGNPDDDVWFTFTGNGVDSYTVTLRNSPGYNGDMEIFNGSTPAAPVVVCQSATTAGLTETYNLGVVSGTRLIRVFDNLASFGGSGQFSICVNTVAAPPSNDDVCGAIGLTTSGTCINTSGNMVNATASPQAACSGTPNRDMWYSFSPLTAADQIRVQSLGTVNAVLQVFSSDDFTCTGVLTSVACVNNTSTGGLETASGPWTVGQTYFIRVYHFAGGSASGQFNICITGQVPGCVVTTVPSNAGTLCTTGGGATLSWTAVAGASVYDVFLNAGAGPAVTQVAFDQAGTSFNTAPLTNGLYSWRIVPKNAVGDAIGCTDRTFTVAPAPVATITAGGPTSFCAPGGVTLTANNPVGSTRVWSPGGATTLSISATATGNYTVAVTVGACTTVSAPIAVTAQSAPLAGALTATPSIICSGGASALSVTGSYNYCASTHANGCNSGDPIVLVELEDLSNPSGCSAGAYTDFTALSASLLASTIYSLDVTMGTDGSQFAGAWIDYNADGDFDDAGEFLGANAVNAGANGTATIGFETPFDAVNGSLRMRIVAGNDSPVLGTQSCGASSSPWGETEDYTINMSGGTGVGFTYEWAPAVFLDDPFSPTPVASNIAPLPYTYTVTVTSPLGCEGTGTVQLVQDNTDTDGDGVIDCIDTCPTVVGVEGGPCVLNASPYLSGQLVSCNCVPNACAQPVIIELRADAGHANEAGWEILDPSNFIVCKGGYLDVAYGPNQTPQTDFCCLEAGSYRLRVYDSAGDGFVSAGNATGGYQLREASGSQRRIIDNFTNFTNLTGGPPDISALLPTLDNGRFDLPVGTDAPIFASCDKEDWVNYNFIVATENPAVSAQFLSNPTNSGYEFWFFDPNGGYSYRRFRSHSTTDGTGTGATRACHFKINRNVPPPPGNQATNQEIPYSRLLNVRIRGRANGINLTFGPACRFKIDAARAACPLVKLQDNVLSSDYSCGVSKVFGGVNSTANKIVANPPQFAPAVSGSLVRFQYRFRVPGEIDNVLSNPWACVVRPPQTSATLYLNWTTGQKLKCNTTYEVDVRVSKDGGLTWCVGGATSNPADCGVTVSPWGKVCNVTIGTSTFCPSNLEGGGNNLAVQGNGALTMYPNPNRGDQVFISLSEVATGVNTVSVDIFDLSGKKVTARTIAVQDGNVNTFLQLNGDLAGGMYMVNITAGDKTYTERLVIQP